MSDNHHILSSFIARGRGVEDAPEAQDCRGARSKDPEFNSDDHAEHQL